jgi:uncharacterized phiE125 gp8 family phage protein
MALTLVTAPTVEPITLADAKLQARVDTGDEDAFLESLITAARQHAESFTRRALCTQTWDLKLEGFPCGAFVLPYPPVSAITSVTYVDTSGSSQTWSSALYRTSLPSGPKASPAQIEPVWGESYPATREVSDAVTVRFVAGYGGASDVPAPIKTAIKLLVAHWFEQRLPVSVGVGNTVIPVPYTTETLLWPFRVF